MNHIDFHVRIAIIETVTDTDNYRFTLTTPY